LRTALLLALLLIVVPAGVCRSTAPQLHSMSTGFGSTMVSCNVTVSFAPTGTNNPATTGCTVTMTLQRH
jgi:hypothetical protein